MTPLTKRQMKALAHCLKEQHLIEIHCFVKNKRGAVEYGVASCSSCGGTKAER